MNPSAKAEAVAGLFRKTVQKDAKIHNAYLLVDARKQGLHLNLAEGRSGDIPAHPEQPVFMASVGKLFTAVLAGILFEQKKLSFDDPLIKHVDAVLLENLHVYQGVDYTSEICLRHLLNHTSGLYDYFEDKPRQGQPMLKTILGEPERAWTPQEIVTWSKENLKPRFPPGQGFHYSDTGYHLLGLAIESAAGVPFTQALNRYIFEPTGMSRAYLLHHSQPLQKSPYPTAGVYLGKENVIGYRSLSADFAGGGVTAPMEELFSFMKALVNGSLLSPTTLGKMRDWARFSIGIDYGYGIMNFTTVPVLMPKKYNAWGNAGSTGSFLFYHPEQDAYLVGSLNQFRYHTKGIRLMLRVIDLLRKK
jgi:D-alanyl-D-alanine carboxypeptidase